MEVLLYFFFVLIGECYDSPNYLSISDKQNLLDLHNKYREIAAMGLSPGEFPKPDAKEMQRLVWDDGLSRLATYRTALCISGHPDIEYPGVYGTPSEMWIDLNYKQYSSFDTSPAHPYIGENTATNTLYPAASQPWRTFNISVIQWNDEQLIFRWNLTTNEGECEGGIGDKCGHWVQLTWAKTRYVGCGFSDCTSILNRDQEFYNDGAIIFSCLYYPAMKSLSFPWSSGGKYYNCWGCFSQDRPFCQNNLCSGGLASMYLATNRQNKTIDQCDDGLGRPIIPCRHDDPTLAPNTPPTLRPSWAPTPINTTSPTIAVPTQTPITYSPTLESNLPTNRVVSDSTKTGKPKTHIVTIVVPLVLGVLVTISIVIWFIYTKYYSKSTTLSFDMGHVSPKMKTQASGETKTSPVQTDGNDTKIIFRNPVSSDANSYEETTINI